MNKYYKVTTQEIEQCTRTYIIRAKNKKDAEKKVMSSNGWIDCVIANTKKKIIGVVGNE